MTRPDDSQILAHIEDVIVIIDVEQRVTFWNRAAEAMYGVPAAEALGKPWSELMGYRWPSLAEGEVFTANMARDGRSRGEAIARLRSGREINIEISVARVRDHEGREIGTLGIVRDISPRKEAERQKALHEGRLRLALKNLDMAMFEQDRDLRYTWTYRPQLVGEGEPIGKTDYDFLAELGIPDIAKVIAVKKRVLESGVSVRTEVLFHIGEAQAWYDLAVEPIRDPSGAVIGISGASHNVTDRKATEDQLRQSREALRALTRRIHSIREEEQKRISRDLHDELGQLLTALKIELRSLEKMREAIGGDGLLDRLVAASALVDETISTARRISQDLRPGLLDRLGLVPALNADIRRFEQRTGIACERKLPDPQPSIRPEVATALYRICQEAMTNVSRHTQAARVSVRLEVASGRATLEVEDDGRGFETSETATPGALGLMGMVERAEALGGHVSFHRGAGGGTLVTADIPLEKPPP